MKFVTEYRDSEQARYAQRAEVDGVFGKVF